MAKLIWPGSALSAPIPAALVTCGTMEKPNVLTVAWTGTVCTNPPMVYVSIRPSRYSYPLIKESGELVINLTTVELATATDKCGVFTGAKVNKFEQNKLTPLPASKVACPILAESPLSLECRVKSVTPLGTHDMFLCEVVAVDVDESLVDANGALHLDRAKLLAYAHGGYYELGKCIGTFGWAVKKKKKAVPSAAKRSETAKRGDRSSLRKDKPVNNKEQTPNINKKGGKKHENH